MAFKIRLDYLMPEEVPIAVLVTVLMCVHSTVSRVVRPEASLDLKYNKDICIYRPIMYIIYKPAPSPRPPHSSRSP